MSAVFPLSYTTTFPLSDAGEVRLRIARLTLGQAMAFRRQYQATRERESVRRLSVRHPGDEQAKRPVGRPRTAAEEALLAAVDAAVVPDDVAPSLRAVVDAARRVVADAPTDDVFVVPDEEIRRRRLAEMTRDDRAAWTRLVEEEEAAEVAFLTQAIATYVALEPGQVSGTGASGETTDIVTGEDILRVWGNKIDDLRALVALVRIENDLSESRKKALRSLYGSGGSSPAPAEVATAGTALEPTAAPVDGKASAGSAAAMESSAT
jgi:hypothetical protein